MESDESNNKQSFSEEIGEKEKLKLKARGNKQNAWFGLGMFGIVGWSVAVPALLGTLLGVWLDKTHGQSFSWTLTFLVIGLVTGCGIAWYWVVNEDKDTHQ